MNSTLLEVLDFEVDVNMVIKDEPKNLQCSRTLQSLQKEFTFPNNSSNSVNKEEIKTGDQILKEATDEMRDDCNLTSTPENLSGSEAGEIDDKCSTKVQEDLSASEAGEIGKEELEDAEDGEISDSPIKKPVCRFFVRGHCNFGPHCNFLHVSDRVYKMFDAPPSFEAPRIIVPCFPPPPPPPQITQYQIEDGSSWEKGLQTAKAMIKDSIKKKSEDKEFDNKKWYLSPEIPKPNLMFSRDKETKSEHNTSNKKLINAEPLKALVDKENKKKEKHSVVEKDSSNFEYKWIDPWMRLNKKSSKSYVAKKRHRSLSSPSSLEDIVVNPAYKNYDDKPALKPSFDDSCCRSFSRSRSRRRSRSRSLSRTPYSARSSSRKKSPSYRKPKRHRIRSSSLEKWYKKEVSSARRSRSPSSSSMDSRRSYESSMTVSSLSASHSSSCYSSSSNESKPRSSERKKLVPEASDPCPPRISPPFLDHIRSYIRCNKQKDVPPKQIQKSAPEVKLPVQVNKPPVQVKKPPKKKNPAFMELFKYTNCKPDAGVGKHDSNQQASKFQDLDGSTSDYKGCVSSNPRKTITLNLQAPKPFNVKASEVRPKLSNVFELSKNNQGIISKKEALIKQLKLVEQAIARKKNVY